MLQDVRAYIDRLHIDGHTIGEDHDDDPVLIDPDGRAVDTWRENYPYDERMPREEYDEAKYQLQVELLKFQKWAADTGTKHVLLFEGRDAAGKGGTIKRFMEHLNPRYARTVALSKPNNREQNQWYFQRYVRAPADRRRDRDVRPLLVQPRRGRAGDGLRLAPGVRAVHRPGAAVRADARRQRHLAHEVLVLGHPVRAANPLHHPPDRPGAAVEALPHRPRVARQVGRLHGRQGGDDPAHRHRLGAVDERSRATTRSAPG